MLRSRLHNGAISKICFLGILLSASACAGDPVRPESGVSLGRPAYVGGYIGADNRTAADSTSDGNEN
jgi:hypothetical protein